MIEDEMEIRRIIDTADLKRYHSILSQYGIIYILDLVSLFISSPDSIKKLLNCGDHELNVIETIIIREIGEEEYKAIKSNNNKKVGEELRLGNLTGEPTNEKNDEEVEKDERGEQEDEE